MKVHGKGHIKLSETMKLTSPSKRKDPGGTDNSSC